MLSRTENPFAAYKNRKATPESLTEETTTPVTISLKKLLADHYVMYFKAQSFHWNVKGPNFAQYHDFFGKIYEDVYEQIDVIAEEMRSADDYAPFNFEELIKESNVKEEAALVTDVNTMLSKLKEANDLVIASLMEVFDAAEAANNQGLIDYIGGRLDAHKKHGWMMKSSLNEDVQEAGYMDEPKTKAEVEKKDYDKPEGDSRDVQMLKVKEALQELKIKKLDKDTMAMLKSLDPDEARMVIQGLPSSLRRKAMKELGLKEKVDGRTKGYKETVKRLTAVKEAIAEGAVAASTVHKELQKNGAKNIKVSDKEITFKMNGKMHSVPVDKRFVSDKDYMKLHDMLNEEAEKHISESKMKKAKPKDHIPGSEKTPKGYRAAIFHDGQHSYLGSKVYKFPDAAKGEAEVYHAAYFKKGEKAADNAVDDYRHKHANQMVEEASVEEKKPGKTYKISFESINRPNEKKILDFLSQHEKQGNIDLVAQEDKGLTFKVVDEDAVRGLHLELRKFKVVAQEVKSVKEAEQVEEAMWLVRPMMLKKGDDTHEYVQASSEKEALQKGSKDLGMKPGSLVAVKTDKKVRGFEEVDDDDMQRYHKQMSEDSLEEKKAFIYAAAQAKADGKGHFEFNGKKYKVKLKSGPVLAAAVKEEEEENG